MARTEENRNLKRKLQEKSDATPAKHFKSKPTADEPSSSTSRTKTREDDEPKTNFLSLNDDVIFEIFNFLSLDDLCAISQQCQRLYDLAEYHFNRRYPIIATDLKLLVESDDVLKYLDCTNLASLCFANFPKFTLDYATGSTKKSMATVNSFDNIPVLLKLNSIFQKNAKQNLIKELRFEKWLGLTPLHGQGLKEMVGKAESVIFAHTVILDEFYETILKYASSMEELILWQSFEIDCKQEEQCKWLLQRYPNLKRFTWHAKQELIVSEEVKTFFEQNDSIEHFSLLASNIQTIQHCVKYKIEINDVFFKLKGDVALILWELKIFCGENTSKRLHLLFEDSCLKELENNLGLLMKLERNIDGLYFEDKIITKTLATSVNKLVNLKFLQVRGCDMVKKYLVDLSNLEELYIARPVKAGTFEAIRDTMLQFASRSAKLKKIYFRNNTQSFQNFNFHEFDTERKKLENAEDLIIYAKTQETGYVLRGNKLEYETFRLQKPRTQDINNPLIKEFIYSNTSLPQRPRYRRYRY